MRKDGETLRVHEDDGCWRHQLCPWKSHAQDCIGGAGREVSLGSGGGITRKARRVVE